MRKVGVTSRSRLIVVVVVAVPVPAHFVSSSHLPLQRLNLPSDGHPVVRVLRRFSRRHSPTSSRSFSNLVVVFNIFVVGQSDADSRWWAVRLSSSFSASFLPVPLSPLSTLAEPRFLLSPYRFFVSPQHRHRSLYLWDVVKVYPPPLLSSLFCFSLCCSPRSPDIGAVVVVGARKAERRRVPCAVRSLVFPPARLEAGAWEVAAEGVAVLAG